MRSCLIVANQTLASPSLTAAVDERIRSGAVTFHVVVPATPVAHGLTWDEGESFRAAHERLEAILARLRSLGVRATGEVGSPDPIDAVHDALRDRTVDEVVLSTLPPGISRWLRQDVPSRLRDAIDVPLHVVVGDREPVGQPGR